MSKFSKLRELVALANNLEAEAAKMSSRGQGYWDRVIAAAEYRLKAEWLAGRLTTEEYGAELVECLDAKNCPDGV
jgi:hypothetical protein